MICSHCSNEIQDGVRFCPHCGAEQTKAAAHEGETASFDTATKTAYETACSAREQETQKQKMATSVMIWGIVSLAVAYAVNAIAGLILANIARSKVAEYESLYTIVEGRAKLGKTLSTVARILSIVGIVAMAILVFVYIILFAMYGILLTDLLSY